MEYKIRVYLHGEIESFTLTGLKVLTENAAREAVRTFAVEGFWKSDNEFVPPAMLKSLSFYKVN